MEESRRQGTGFWKYQKRFWVRFWKDSIAWPRDNIFWGIVVLVIPPLIAFARNKVSAPDWETIRLTLWLYGGAFACYVLIYLVRIPWELDKEREKDVVSLEVERDKLENDYAAVFAGPKFSGHFYQTQIFPRTRTVDPDFLNQASNLIQGRPALDKSNPVKCDFDIFVEAYVQNDASGLGKILEYVLEIEFDGKWIKLAREFNYKGWVLEREESQMNARESLKVVKRTVTKPIPDLSESGPGILEQNKGVEGWLHYLLKDTAYTEFDGVKKHGWRLTLRDVRAECHIIARNWDGEPRPWSISHDFSI